MLGTLAGPYRLEAQIGAGGMGTVWLATVEGAVPGLPVGERVALKIVHPHLVVEADVFERFVREAGLGRAIRHENVVRTLDAGMDVTDDRIVVYLAMEYVQGRTLHAIGAETGPAPEGFVRRVAREAARGLAAVHERGVVHGDVKPENLLLARDDVVKVMDLGLARLRGGAQRSGAGAGFAGSLLYAAPEQFGRDQDAVDGRSDLFALGVTIHELATGRHPWHGPEERVVVPRQIESDAPRLRDLRPDVSPFLDAVVHGLLQRDPDRRIRSASELAAILASAEDGAWFRLGGARSGAPSPSRSARLHGREEEMAELWRLARRAAGGAGATAVIEGEPGAGVSRLVDEFASAATARGLLTRVERRAFGPGRSGADVPAGLDAAAHGALVVVEGAEHATAAGWDAAAAAARRVHAAGGVAIVTSAGPMPLARREALDPAAVRIRLGPLSDAAIAEIAADVLLAGRAAPSLVQHLAGISARHAGSVVAWLTHMLTARALRSGDDGTWSLAPAALGLAPPAATVAWGARAVGGVPTEDRDLLEACAAAGTSFDPSDVGAVLGRSARDVEGRLGTLARRGLVDRAAGDRWRFTSRPAFDALRAGIAPSLLEEYARAFADGFLAREVRTDPECADLLRFAAAGGVADVPADDVERGLAHLAARGAHAEVVAVTGALLAACGDAAWLREARIRRGLSLLELGCVAEGAAAIGEACAGRARGASRSVEPD